MNNYLQIFSIVLICRLRWSFSSFDFVVFNHLLYRQGEWYQEKRVLNIFIQHQYLGLMDIYKKASAINYNQLTREFTRIEVG